jgi:hypothetical protein
MSGTPPEANPIRVTILAYPGVDELDLFGAYAVLSKAASIAVGRSVGARGHVTAEPGSARAVPVPEPGAAERGLEVHIAASSPEIISSGGVTFGAQGTGPARDAPHRRRRRGSRRAGSAGGG